MNKNEKSLVEHALRLYDLNYEYKITNYKGCIVIYPISYKISGISILDGLEYYYGEYNEYYPVDKALLDLSNNIRSFVNHWKLHYNFTGNISHVATRMCHNNMYDINVRADVGYRNILCPHTSRINGWTVYKW